MDADAGPGTVFHSNSRALRDFGKITTIRSGAAIAGLIYKSLVHRHKIVMPLLYLALGWVAVGALHPLRAAMAPERPSRWNKQP